MGWSDEVAVVGVNEYALVGAFVFLILVIPLALQRQYVVLAIAGVILALILYSYLSASRRVGALLKALDEGRPIALTAGVLETYYTGGGRRQHWTRFTPAGETSQVEPGPFLYMRGASWEYLRAHAFRVEDRCCRGLYLVVVDPAQSYTLSGEITAASPSGDWAAARVRPLGPGAA
ncbi:MAG: hypothetical protein ABWK05_08785, partial [Pyrobaculum sp.]